MTQLGESVNVVVPKPVKLKFFLGAVIEVTFDSGIKLWQLAESGVATEVPPAGVPHWSRQKGSHPSVHVRQGGQGEVKTLKVKVSWVQSECDGSAKLEGTSSNGEVKIAGDFSISGPRGEAVVDCEFTLRPDVVKNYGRGLQFAWNITAGGDTYPVSGGSPLKLYFVDRKPLPVTWGNDYKSFYVPIAEWATQWAADQQGPANVLKALWKQFSDGTGALVPHVTGFSYWKTGSPVQDLINLLRPGSTVRDDGWSCTAIAHLFMECLALHGIKCQEVIPIAAVGTRAFLVENWQLDLQPVPNWPTHPEDYYGGSWVGIDVAPLSRSVATSEAWVIDCRKLPGVPAQGQNNAPLSFRNHWIVRVAGKLYDTSYGSINTDSPQAYGSASLAGWLVRNLSDTPPGTFEISQAWICQRLSEFTLRLIGQRSN